MTANKATKMYVRLMSNTIDVPETNRRDVFPDSVVLTEHVRFCMLVHPYTFKLLMQVIHICDEAVVGKQEAHSSQQHCKIDAMVTVVRDWFLKV